MALNQKTQVGNDPDSTIIFPPFVLDLRGGRLLHGNEALRVRPKTWAVLRYLAERPDVLVTKEELFSQIWTGTAIGDDGLTKSIREIRAVLNDNVKRPRFIETVHKRGFRFVARIDRRPELLQRIDGRKPKRRGRATAASASSYKAVGRQAVGQ